MVLADFRFAATVQHGDVVLADVFIDDGYQGFGVRDVVRETK
jgi:hypothetical protein